MVTHMKLAALSAVAMLVAVASGAFGAHALRDTLSPSDMVIWEKAVLYNMVHGLAAIVIALAAESGLEPVRLRNVARVFLISLCIFSGSLYLLVLLNQRWLGMVTPLGGAGFMIAWAQLAHILWGLKVSTR
jgi:uncharacterized membrane protein YgdD (TMEM256/DUF423 family)